MWCEEGGRFPDVPQHDLALGERETVLRQQGRAKVLYLYWHT